jgi:hypothetical protein
MERFVFSAITNRAEMSRASVANLPATVNKANIDKEEEEEEE